MPTTKLTIVPVTLNPIKENASLQNSTQGSSCIIKTVTTEISFTNGADERIIQIIMKELNCR